MNILHVNKLNTFSKIDLIKKIILMFYFNLERNYQNLFIFIQANMLCNHFCNTGLLSSIN